MKVKIFVAHHKPGYAYKSDIYEPIQVGRAVADSNLAMIGDNTGDNISHLNPWYCELTAQYWVWKNIKDLEYAGFCHYRRYYSIEYNKKEYLKSFLKYSALLLAGNILRPGKHYPLYPADKAIDKEEFVSKVEHFGNSISTKLNSIDLVVLKPAFLSSNTIGSLCERYLTNEHFPRIHGILNDIYPEYQDSYQKVMAGRRFLGCNMYIMKWSLFDSYMTWLFSILDRYHAEFGVNCEHDKRIYGYFAEHLSQVYIKKNGIKKYSANILENEMPQ